MTKRSGPIRVAFLIDSLSSGGAQRQAVEIACWLRQTCNLAPRFVVYHDIDFFGPRLRAAGVPLTVLRKHARVDPTLVFRLRRWLSKEQIEVLHAFLPAACLYGFLATRSLGLRRRQTVFIAGERLDLASSDPWQLAVQKWVYPRSDAITANAGPTAREIAERFGIPGRRVHYIPNGIDLEAWDQRASEKAPFELEAGALHLALVGGLRAQKNHDVLLAALATLTPSERAPWRVWFIGDETGAPGQATRVRTEVARLGLDAMVRIVPATPGIPAIMRRLSALVLPSASEGFPNVLLEAMASKLPAIASRVGDVPNMIEDGVTGFLVEAGDVEGLASALRRLFRASSAERVAMGIRARAVVEQRYPMSIIARQYERVYGSLRPEQS